MKKLLFFKDVPLPHELRPSSVLAMAMAHLLANVIDRIEDDSGASSVSVEEYYDAIESGKAAERNGAPENPGRCSSATFCSLILAPLWQID